jgi:aryl-alcohol dehydrogenase-like predicted oxidoreductase
MEYAQLGKTDLKVSRICFGCWQLSPRFWGDVPLEPWRAALRRAVDLGVNFVDTAGAYGDGYAETCLGDYLSEAKLRDRLVLATKVYWNFRAEERYPDTSRMFIVQECEDSLRRLRTDRIDLLQIHAWDPLTRPDEVADAFAQLKKQGKVRWAGVSNLNVEQMELYREAVDVQSLQPPYSLLAREAEEREFPYCVRHRISVLAYSPLYRGLLTGKYEPGHRYGDHRDSDPLFGGEAYAHVRLGLERLRPLAEASGLTLAQFAVRWVLTHPAVTSAIVGIKTAEQIETIAPAANDVLPAMDWHKAAAVMKQARLEASDPAVVRG